MVLGKLGINVIIVYLQSQDRVLGSQHHVEKLAIVNSVCVSFVDLFDHLFAFQVRLRLTYLL